MGSLSCGSETMDLNVSLHTVNDTCFWRVISEEFYLDERFEIDGTEGRTCEKPILEIGSPFIECPGTITIQKFCALGVPWIMDEDGCPDPLCKGCDCFPPCLCITFEGSIDGIASFGRETACFDPYLGGWQATIYTETKSFFESCDPDIPGVVDIEIILTSNEYTGGCEAEINYSLNGVPQPTEILTLTNCPGPPFVLSAGSVLSILGIFCDESCEDCCPDVPDTLTATVELCCCSVQVQLTRLTTGSDVWSGTGDCDGQDIVIFLWCLWASGSFTYRIDYACPTCGNSHGPPVTLISCDPFQVEFEDGEPWGGCCDCYLETGTITITE